MTTRDGYFLRSLVVCCSPDIRFNFFVKSYKKVVFFRFFENLGFFFDFFENFVLFENFGFFFYIFDFFIFFIFLSALKDGC